MYTQCPECLSVYALDAAVLAQGHGSVRCAHCTMVFDALPSLSETLPPGPFTGLPARPPSAEPPLLVQPIFRPMPDLAAEAPDDADAEPQPGPVMPNFVRPRTTPVPTHSLRWIIGCAALAVLLIGQLAWANRGALASDPGTRSILARVCAALSCTLPPIKDVSRLTLLSRDIRPHPSVPGALIISATVRNDADFTQPYPVIRIALSDLDGNAIAMRRFRPAEYVSDPQTRAAGLPPDGTVAAVFEVEDPGRNAVAFEFGFE
ncbi:MAG TPA: zinc-ribbon and DUF3426 domain-containing protein [Rhodanobacteraceae bacterium]|nr:zinc-ribbon and DUF3426 domain-containing protein [Rhodanobacteraceae bacterium]